MKYTTEQTNLVVTQYKSGVHVDQIAAQLQVPSRSVIAKLSSLGVYERKRYLNKRGEPPIKKEVYITQIAQLLGVDETILDSLEKCNKHVLGLLVKALSQN